METFEDDIAFSDLARDLELCPGCGEPKQSGCIVCWDCFKYRTDKTPLKYFEGQDWNNPLQEWLDYLKA